MSYNPLNLEEARVILEQGTEVSFQGEYDQLFQDGTYICRQCNNPLFDATAKFDAGCGWPAFDDHIADAVKQIPDKDGRRIEIRCATCQGHLGHVFIGEKMTDKNIRHCVNSISTRFIPRGESLPTLLQPGV